MICPPPHCCGVKPILSDTRVCALNYSGSSGSEGKQGTDASFLFFHLFLLVGG